MRNIRSGTGQIKLNRPRSTLCEWYHDQLTKRTHEPYKAGYRRIYKQFRVFYSDDQDGGYTYRRKAKPEDKWRVYAAVQSAMEGFRSVVVRHIHDNIYELGTDGPDENTSHEMRNLSQIGEYTPFTIRMERGFDYMAETCFSTI